MAKGLGGLWRHPDFRRLWAGETVSMLGSEITALALPLTAVLVLRASPFEMGLLGTLEFLPFLLISLFAGVWADRLRRRPILIVANLGRALLLGTIPLAALGSFLSMPYLYIMALSVGALTVFFDVTYQSYLPALVEREQLVEGNSKLEASRSVAHIAGPALGGWLVQLLTAPVAIAVDAASFLFSALCLWRIRAAEPQIASHSAQAPIWHEIREGLGVVLGSPILRAIAACTGSSNFFANMQAVILTLYAVRQLGLNPGALGLVFATGSVGALIGALSADIIARRIGVGPTIIGSMLMGGLASLALPLAAGPLPLVVAVLIAGQLLSSAANPIYNITQVSLRQAITPQRLQGRMNASMRFLVWGTIPLGSLAGGTLGELIGLRATLAVGAVGSLLPFLWVLLSPVRGLREQPQPADEPVTSGVVS